MFGIINAKLGQTTNDRTDCRLQFANHRYISVEPIYFFLSYSHSFIRISHSKCSMWAIQRGYRLRFFLSLIIFIQLTSLVIVVMVIFFIATVIFIHVTCVAHRRRGEQRKKKKVKRFIIYNIANATKVIRISLGPGVMRCGAVFLLFFFFIPDRVSLLFPSLNAIFLCCAPQQIHSMNINRRHRTKSFCIDSVAMLNRCHLFKYTGLVIVIAFFSCCFVFFDLVPLHQLHGVFHRWNVLFLDCLCLQAIFLSAAHFMCNEYDVHDSIPFEVHNYHLNSNVLWISYTHTHTCKSAPHIRQFILLQHDFELCIEKETI